MSTSSPVGAAAAAAAESAAAAAVTSHDQERPMSPSDLKNMFVIPPNVLKMLEEPADTFGPLVPKGDDTVLGLEVIAKAVEESLRRNTNKQNSVADDPSLSDPAQIIELFLDGANLVALGRPPAAYPLSVMKKLRKLVLSNNRLQISSPVTKNDVDFQAAVLSLLPELRELQLDHNLLSHFKGISHGKLETLNLSGNDIHVLEQCTLPRLEYLDLSGNHHLALVTLCKSKWQALINIDISRCGLDSLQPLSNAPSLQQHLRSLNVSRNELTSLLGIESLPGLEFINASHNKLKHSRIAGVGAGRSSGAINPLTSCASALQELHLQDNNISTLAFFPSSGMKKLWKLLLSGNPLGGQTATAAAAAGNENQAGEGKQVPVEDDIGTAEYDDDDNAKLGTVVVQRGNVKASGAGGIAVKRKTSRLTGAAPAAGAAAATVSSTGRSSSAAPKEPPQQQPVTNRGIAAKLAALCPNCEVLDLSRTGVVSTKAELEGVCHELSRGCIYLRELDLPLPLGSDDEDQRAAVKAGTATQEESALIDFVVAQMSYLARFNGYMVRDESTISVAEEARKAEHRQQLGAALEELKDLEHLVDGETMKMLRDFTVEASELEAGIAERERKKNQLVLEQQRADASAAAATGVPGATAAVSRPGSASGVKSSIPKQRPVVRTSAFSKSLDAQAQRERDTAKTEFEVMMDEILTSRRTIEATLDHVAGVMEVAGVDAPKSGSPFKEVEEERRKQREREQRRLEKEQQDLRADQLRDKLAAKAEPVANLPHPPPQSKAAATNAKLAEKLADDAAQLRKKMARSEQHVREAVYPSATPFSSSVTGRSSATLSSRTSIGGVTPAPAGAAGAASSSSSSVNNSPSKLAPLGKQRSANQKVAGLVDSSSSDDDGDAPSAVKSTRGPAESSSLAKEVAAAAAAAKQSNSAPDVQARASKWSNEKKEPLSQRLARIAEEFGAGESARDKPLSSETMTTTPNHSSTSPKKQQPSNSSSSAGRARPASAGNSTTVASAAVAPAGSNYSPPQQLPHHSQPRVSSAGASTGSGAHHQVPSSSSSSSSSTAAGAARNQQQQQQSQKPIVSFATTSLNVRRKM